MARPRATMTKKRTLRFTPPITAQASPKSARACPGGCASGTERLLRRPTPRPHVVPQRRAAAVETPLVAQPLEDRPHRVPLPARRLEVRAQDLVDEADMRLQLRPAHRNRAPVAGRLPMARHLRHLGAVDPEPPRRLPVAQAVTEHRKSNSPVKLHPEHPPASGSTAGSEDLSVAGFATARRRRSPAAQVADCSGALLSRRAFPAFTT